MPKITTETALSQAMERMREDNNAIVDTFNSGRPHQGVAATLQVKKAGGDERRVVQVSTEKLGELALVRIERYDRTDER